MTQNEINYKNLEVLLEFMDHEELLNELCQAMSAQELRDNIEHVAQM